MMYTKAHIKAVMKMWETKDKHQIAKELNIPLTGVNYLATAIRREGGKLSRKRKVGQTKLLIREVIAEMNG